MPKWRSPHASPPPSTVVLRGPIWSSTESQRQYSQLHMAELFAELILTPAPTQEEASLKPPCGTLKFKLLLDQLLIDGFCTAHEPLLCNFPVELSNQNLDQMWSDTAGKDWMGV